MRYSAHELISRLQLTQHPEGGWYRETFRAAEMIPAQGLPVRFGDSRAVSTAIYFLLERGDISALHRIKSDELWHFYSGTGLTIHFITPGGEHQKLRLGSNIKSGESFQAVVPAGCWFGAEVSGGGEYSLAGCTVAPGFDFADFEMGNRGDLLAEYPEHTGIIRQLTVNSEQISNEK